MKWRLISGEADSFSCSEAVIYLQKLFFYAVKLPSFNWLVRALIKLPEMYFMIFVFIELCLGLLENENISLGSVYPRHKTAKRVLFQKGRSITIIRKER